MDHGNCQGCGRTVVLEPDPLNETGEGVAKVFDPATNSYVTWHRSCRSERHAGDTDALLPEPPRRRYRATEGD